jgi:hypothetical protein
MPKLRMESKWTDWNPLESTGISGVQLVQPEYVGECKLLGREDDGFINWLQWQFIQTQVCWFTQRNYSMTPWQDLPQYMQICPALIQREPRHQQLLVPRPLLTGLVCNPFRFWQLIITPTELEEIDTSTRDVVWIRALGLGWAGELGLDGTVVMASLTSWRSTWLSHWEQWKQQKSRRCVLLLLQSPLDHLDLRYLTVITPYALCYGFILFIIPYAQQLVSWTIIAISPVHTATTQHR